MFAHFGWGNEDKTVVAPLATQYYSFEFYCDELRKDPLERRRLAITNLDFAGTHARLVLHHGPEAPFGSQNLHLVQLRLVAGYYLRRFVLRDDMPAFLSGVTKLERLPLDAQPRCN
jgi:hypothetical protein